MFLSETYNYLQEGDTAKADFLNITLNDPAEQKLTTSKSFSKSENDLHKMTRHTDKKSNSYDADTDTDPEETVQSVCVEFDNVLQCEICHLEFTSCHEDKFNTLNQDVTDQMPPSFDHKNSRRFGRRKTIPDKSSRKSKNKRDYERNLINFEDYKDCAHKMEEFAPESERVWTLQYHFSEYQPKLSKIIIGRGHRNEYPELNNIHLFDEVKGYKQVEWRNDWLRLLKEKNNNMKDTFGLYPTTNTCLFCFEERSKEVTYAIQNGLTLKPKPTTMATGTELNNTSNDKKDKIQAKGNEEKVKRKIKVSSLFKKHGKSKNVIEKNNLPNILIESDIDDEEFTII